MRHLLCLTLISACTVEPAPEDVDGALMAWWRDYDGEDDRLTQLAVATLDILDEAALIDGDETGTQSRLAPEDIAHLAFFDADGDPLDPPDPEFARPLYLIDRQDCTIEQVRDIFIFPDQNQLYGQYEDYERHYKGDVEAFRRGDTDFLAWSGRIEVSSILPDYAYEFESDTRRFPLPEDDPRFGGSEGVMARTWMPFPAEFVKPENNRFDQDYQLELYLPMPEGDVLHVYPVWRRMDLNGLGTMENEANATITLGRTRQWGRRTEELCAEGLPDPE